MDEKVIISSDSRNVKGVITRILVYGLVLAVAAALAAFVMRLLMSLGSDRGGCICDCIMYCICCVVHRNVLDNGYNKKSLWYGKI